LEAYFGCTLAFSADVDEIAFASEFARCPLGGADPYLNRLLVGYCAEILARRPQPVCSIRNKVENAIAPRLPHGSAQVDEIASSLGMSRRTLSRQLAAEGLTFAGILEEMRTELALQHLKDPQLSVSQIAWLLGYQEASAFTTAFKRWTGTTPSATRARSLSLEEAV
jgi:AraC-like DNA-binding protein